MTDKTDEIMEEVIRAFEAIGGVREDFRDPLPDQFFEELAAAVNQFLEDIAATMEVTNARLLDKRFNFLDPDHIVRWWLVFLPEYSIIWARRYPCLVEEAERWEPVLEPLWVLGCKLAREKGTLEPLDYGANEIRAGTGIWRECDENRRREMIKELDDYRNAVDKAIDELIEAHRLAMRRAARATLAQMEEYDEATLFGKLLLYLKAIAPGVRRG